MRFLALILLAASLPALAQTKADDDLGLDLAPLVAPAPRRKKTRPEKPKPSPVGASPKAQDPTPAPYVAVPPAPLPLPAPAAPKLPDSVGVAVLGPAQLAARLEAPLVAIARLAPLNKTAQALRAACADDACLAQAAAKARLDQVLVADARESILRVRLLDAATARVVGEQLMPGVAREGDEAAAALEAMACHLLVPGGCTGEVAVAAPEGAELQLDGKPLPKTAAVGVHELRARLGARQATRTLAVLHEKPAAATLRFDQAEANPEPSPRAVAAREPAAPAAREPAPPAAALVRPVEEPAPQTWTRTARLVAFGLAGGALAGGALEGAHSRSSLGAAESAYRAQGGYRPADLDALHSGNSAARAANLLFVAGALCAAAGLYLSF